ncbi:EamA family transporter [Candidatus Saccharibacteria bacterium]|nr:EamA family transporter [Candidatus Saccharibacteria bacterium]
MSSETLLFSGLYLFGVIISAIAQVLLKKSADKKHESKLKEYLNVPTMSAYFMFFLATVCNVFAYKYISLSVGPVLSMTEYIFVAVLSLVFLKEKIDKRKAIGLLIVFVGVAVFVL